MPNNQLDTIMKSHNMTKLEAELYIHLFNTVTISETDRSVSMGIRMYEKFAREVAKYIEKGV